MPPIVSPPSLRWPDLCYAQETDDNRRSSVLDQQTPEREREREREREMTAGGMG